MVLPFLGALADWFLSGVLALFSYITGGNVFPLPLNEQEEAALLLRLELGDANARNTLIERNLRLVAHIVKKFDGTGDDAEDLISIGTIGLIKGINTFKRNRNTRLATYAARCIENEILMHLRAAKKSRNDLMLCEPIGADKEGNEITMLDVLDTGAEVVPEAVEMRMEEEKLREKLGQLSRRERTVIELRYGLCDGITRTQREISKMLGISRSYVSRIEKKALRKLWREMSNNGFRE
ncbi:MAG: RNA polymerase sporulation sigma factor SigK [Patescibacteria group bacterium]